MALVMTVMSYIFLGICIDLIIIYFRNILCFLFYHLSKSQCHCRGWRGHKFHKNINCQCCCWCDCIHHYNWSYPGIYPQKKTSQVRDCNIHISYFQYIIFRIILNYMLNYINMIISTAVHLHAALSTPVLIL